MSILDNRANGVSTVLVVDDDPGARLLVGTALEMAGFRVISAADGTAALSQFREQTADCVVLDVVMPGINGREMAEAVRKLRPAMRVVFVSGYTDDVALLQQLREQSLHFLQKPFTAQGLGKVIRAAIDTPVD